MAPAYETLQKAGVYHSDTKPQNIVFSIREKVYKLIDFVVSKIVTNAVVKEGNQVVDIEEYAYEGSENCFSPEKKIMWDFVRKNKDLPEENLEFNPFKCDMYSLGVCLRMMVSDKDCFSESIPLLKKILDGLLVNDWKQRMDAKQLCNLLRENNIKPTQASFLNESKHLEALDKERKKKEGFKELYRRFGDAFLQKEMLDVVLQEVEMEKTKKLEDQKWIPIYTRLGMSFLLLN
jgi:serine/threonine protein kinase